MHAAERVPTQVWEPLSTILSWVMWSGLIAGIFAFILAGAGFVYQWKYAHFNTPVAPIRLFQISVCCVVIGVAGAIADTVLG